MSARVQPMSTPRMAALLFVAFFSTAMGSILLTRHGGVTAPFWPSDALALVLLLRWSRGAASDLSLLS